MFYKKEGKWSKVPYVQLFFFLRDYPEWLNKCRVDTQTMVTLCKKSPNSPEEPKNQSDGPSALTLLPQHQKSSHRTPHPLVNYWRG
jgi:hypothetical protein